MGRVTSDVITGMSVTQFVGREGKGKGNKYAPTLETLGIEKIDLSLHQKFDDKQQNVPK